MSLVLPCMHTTGMNWDDNKKRKHGMLTPWEKLLQAAANPPPGECIIEIVMKPANSPDCNKCDLGFFASIDSELPLMRSFKLDELDRVCARRAGVITLLRSCTGWTRPGTSF